MKIKEFIRDHSKADSRLAVLKETPVFSGNSMKVENISYEDMKYLFEVLRSFNPVDGKEMIPDIYSIVYELNKDYVLDQPIKEVFKSWKYICRVIADKQKYERDLLAYEEDEVDAALWTTAAGDDLKGFENITPLINMGSKFGVYPFDLSKKPYTDIIVLMAANKRFENVQKKFQELKLKIQK